MFLIIINLMHLKKFANDFHEFWIIDSCEKRCPILPIFRVQSLSFFANVPNILEIFYLAKIFKSNGIGLFCQVPIFKSVGRIGFFANVLRCSCSNMSKIEDSHYHHQITAIFTGSFFFMSGMYVILA